MYNTGQTTTLARLRPEKLDDAAIRTQITLVKCSLAALTMLILHSIDSTKMWRRRCRSNCSCLPWMRLQYTKYHRTTSSRWLGGKENVHVRPSTDACSDLRMAVGRRRNRITRRKAIIKPTPTSYSPMETCPAMTLSDHCLNTCHRQLPFAEAMVPTVARNTINILPHHVDIPFDVVKITIDRCITFDVIPRQWLRS